MRSSFTRLSYLLVTVAQIGVAAEKPNILFPERLNREIVDRPLRERCAEDKRFERYGSMSRCMKDLRARDQLLPFRRIGFTTTVPEDANVPARERCLDRDIWKHYGSLAQCTQEKLEVDQLRAKVAEARKQERIAEAVESTADDVAEIRRSQRATEELERLRFIREGLKTKN